MTEGRLILMRHGETQYNAEHKMTGRADIPLTEKGVNQAKQVGKIIRHFNIHALYSSSQKRAFNTLVHALDASGTHHEHKNADGSWKIEKRDKLMEKDVGIYTGKLKAELAKTGHIQTYDNRLPGGESNREVVERALEVYEEELLPLIKEGKTVFLSCHSVVMKAFLVILGETSREAMHKTKIPNATPMVVDYKNGQKHSSRFIDPAKVPDKAVVIKRPSKRP